MRWDAPRGSVLAAPEDGRTPLRPVGADGGRGARLRTPPPASISLLHRLDCAGVGVGFCWQALIFSRLMKTNHASRRGATPVLFGRSAGLR